MTIHHKQNPDELEPPWTDRELAEHLISSSCSECVAAGFRLKSLITDYEELKFRMDGLEK